MSVSSIMTTHFMLVSVATSRPPQTRKLRDASAEVARQAGADSKAVHAIKDLWHGCPEMEGIAAAINAASALHRRYTAPYVNEGQRLVQNEILMLRYIPEMGAAITAIEKAADALLAVYDQRVKEQLAKLGGFADVNDYPTVAQINNWDWFNYSLSPVPDAGDWSRVEGVSIGEYLATQTQELVEKAAKDALADAAKRAIEPLERVIYACDPDAPEKRARRVSETLIPNLEQAIELLQAFNIYNDPNVSACIAKCRALTDVSSDQIKASEPLKARLHEEAEEALAALKGFWGEA